MGCCAEFTLLLVESHRRFGPLLQRQHHRSTAAAATRAGTPRSWTFGAAAAAAVDALLPTPLEYMRKAHPKSPIVVTTGVAGPVGEVPFPNVSAAVSAPKADPLGRRLQGTGTGAAAAAVAALGARQHVENGRRMLAGTGAKWGGSSRWLALGTWDERL